MSQYCENCKTMADELEGTKEALAAAEDVIKEMIKHLPPGIQERLAQIDRAISAKERA